MPIKITCPNADCGKSGAVADKYAGQPVRCTFCRTTFTVPLSGGQHTAAITPVPAVNPDLVPDADLRSAVPTTSPGSPETSRRHMLWAGGAVLSLLAILCLAAVIVFRITGPDADAAAEIDDPTPEALTNQPESAGESSSVQVAAVPEKLPVKEAGPTSAPSLPPSPPSVPLPVPPPAPSPPAPAPPPSASVISYSDDPEVNHAMTRGVAFLKSQLQKRPVRANSLLGREDKDHVGLWSLAALTLLECGVPSADPVLAEAVADVREGAVTVKSVYAMSAAILLLDRLGDKADEALIRQLALQLAAGQNAVGGWGYVAPRLLPQGVKNMEKLLRASAPDRSGRDDPLAALPAVRYRPGDVVDFRQPTDRHDDDNSNTQFGALGLWLARKRGVPLDGPLAFVAARFRATQLANGAWGYFRPTGSDPAGRDSMTCAGLLGLALGRAVDKAGARTSALLSNGQAVKALRFLATTLRRAAAEPVPNPVRPSSRPIGSLSDGDLYYLWSLERVGVLYDLQTIGGVDWHDWGTRLLLSVQNEDGSWSDRWGDAVGTSFALLFLKRVHVAEDLTARLRTLGKMIEDPLARSPVPGLAAKRESRPSSSTSSQQKPRDMSSKGTASAARPKGKKDDSAGDALKLQGAWVLASQEVGGRKSASAEVKNATLTITGGQWVFSFGPALPTHRAIVFIDPSKDPKVMELRTPNGIIIWSGLYKLEGDTLTICRPVVNGGRRPQGLRSGPDSILWVWKRPNRTMP